MYLNIIISERQELSAWLLIKLQLGAYCKIARIIFWREQGYSIEEIAVETGYSKSRVYDYIRLFKVGGIEAIRPKPIGRPSKFKRKIKSSQKHFQ